MPRRKKPQAAPPAASTTATVTGTATATEGAPAIKKAKTDKKQKNRMPVQTWALTIEPKQDEKTGVWTPAPDPPAYDEWSMFFYEFVKHQGHKSGLVHYHVLVQFRQPHDMEMVKLMLRCDWAHCEHCRSPVKWQEYLEDGHDTIEAPISFGEFHFGGARTDMEFLMWAASVQLPKRQLYMMRPGLLSKKQAVDTAYATFTPTVPCPKKIQKRGFAPWMQHLKAILEDKADKRSIYWYWSEEGKEGKSTMADWIEYRFGDDCFNVDPVSVKDLSYAYDGQHYVVLDCPRSYNVQFVSYHFLEVVKNGTWMVGKYHSQKRRRIGKAHVVVFANKPPFEARTNLSGDRLQVFEIRNLMIVGLQNPDDFFAKPDPNIV